MSPRTTLTLISLSAIVFVAILAGLLWFTFKQSGNPEENTALPELSSALQAGISTNLNNSSAAASNTPFGNITLPSQYNRPLIVTAFNNTLSITPVNAKSNSTPESIGQDAIQYSEAYTNTDVVQVKQTNKLKEALILKTPNHPAQFVYQINADKFLWEIDKNGSILFKQKTKESRYTIEPQQKNHISLAVDTEYTDGHPVIFKIPALFLIDNNSARSGKEAVRTQIIDNQLILTPDPAWLAQHSYPVVLDPSVEIISSTKEKIELGDANSTDFKPKMKLNKWGDETYVSLEYETNDKGTVDFSNNQLKYQTAGNIDVNISLKDPEKINDLIMNEQGGAEFDLILKQKPATNIFTYRLDSQNLDFFYQPPMNQGGSKIDDRIVSCTETQCFDKDGKVISSRPENVVGSYAVYYKDGKSGDYSQMGGKNYKTGKAFHIFRPQITDALGNKTWGILNIDTANNLLTITIDQKFLDTATYPVTVDPTFGMASYGASWTSNQSDSVVSVASAPAGSVSALHVFMGTFAAHPHARLVMYADSSGVPGARLAPYVEVDAPLSQWDPPQDVSGAYSGTLTQNATYWFGSTMDTSGTAYTRYDDVGGSDYGYGTRNWNSETPPLWDDPWTGFAVRNGQKLSLYCEYTAAAAEPTTNSLPPGGLFINPNINIQRNVSFKVPGCTDTSCAGFLVCQNFEGTGYDNSESWTDYYGYGDIFPDCATGTSDCPLRQSQSLYMVNNNTGIVGKSFTATGEIWFHFLLRPVSAMADANLVVIRANGNSDFEIYFQANGSILVYNKYSTGITSSAGVLTNGTTVHVWGHIKKGTGANGIYQVWVGTTTDRSTATLVVDGNNGTATTDYDEFRFFVNNVGVSFITDQVLVKTAEFTSVCN